MLGPNTASSLQRASRYATTYVQCSSQQLNCFRYNVMLVQLLTTPFADLRLRVNGPRQQELSGRQLTTCVTFIQEKL